MAWRYHRAKGWTVSAARATSMAAAVLLAATGCSGSGDRRQLTVAYSAIGDDNTWFTSFSYAMAAEAGRRGHTYQTHRAVFNSDDQKHQQSQVDGVRELMNVRPDVLVLAPVAVNRAMQAVKVANDAGVPVIIVNRDAESPVPPSSDKYFATIHSDFKNFGKEVCGKQLRKIFGNATVKLLHLKGTAGGSNTIDMADGCEDAMQADGHMEIGLRRPRQLQPRRVLRRPPSARSPPAATSTPCSATATPRAWARRRRYRKRRSPTRSTAPAPIPAKAKSSSSDATPPGTRWPTSRQACNSAP